MNIRILCNHHIHTYTVGSSLHTCRGYIGPGGLADYGKYANCTGGAARLIDVAVFTEAHIYQHPTCLDLYHCLPHDPEGLLGALNSIVICFLGELFKEAGIAQYL